MRKDVVNPFLEKEKGAVAKAQRLARRDLATSSIAPEGSIDQAYLAEGLDEVLSEVQQRYSHDNSKNDSWPMKYSKSLY